MNWFRGLWRLWLVVAVPWIAATAYLNSDKVRTAYSDWTEAEAVDVDEAACANASSTEQIAICDLQRKLQRQSAINRAHARDDLTGAAQWILGPPLALALLMVAVAWVIRGFRP